MAPIPKGRQPLGVAIIPASLLGICPAFHSSVSQPCSGFSSQTILFVLFVCRETFGCLPLLSFACVVSANRQVYLPRFCSDSKRFLPLASLCRECCRLNCVVSFVLSDTVIPNSKGRKRPCFKMHCCMRGLEREWLELRFQH